MDERAERQRKYAIDVMNAATATLGGKTLGQPDIAAVIAQVGMALVAAVVYLADAVREPVEVEVAGE